MPVGQFQASILASASTDATQRYVHCSLSVSIAYSLQDNVAPQRRDALWLSLKVSILQLYVLRNLELWGSRTTQLAEKYVASLFAYWQGYVHSIVALASAGC